MSARIEKIAMSTNLEKLRGWLMQQSPGPISDESAIEKLLKSAWDELEGSDDQSTTASKLCGRVEELSLAPPILTFIIERHGGTVHGSSRANLHQWTVDVEHGTAKCNPKFSYRQIRKTAPRLNVEPIAQEIAELILKEEDDSRLTWDSDKQTVRVEVGQVIGGTNDQTITNRRKRFRKALESILAKHGWVPAKGRARNTYVCKK